MKSVYKIGIIILLILQGFSLYSINNLNTENQNLNEELTNTRELFINDLENQTQEIEKLKDEIDSQRITREENLKDLREHIETLTEGIQSLNNTIQTIEHNKNALKLINETYINAKKSMNDLTKALKDLETELFEIEQFLGSISGVSTSASMTHYPYQYIGTKNVEEFYNNIQITYEDVKLDVLKMNTYIEQHIRYDDTKWDKKYNKNIDVLLFDFYIKNNLPYATVETTPYINGETWESNNVSYKLRWVYPPMYTVAYKTGICGDVAILLDSMLTHYRRISDVDMYSFIMRALPIRGSPHILNGGCVDGEYFIADSTYGYVIWDRDCSRLLDYWYREYRIDYAHFSRAQNLSLIINNNPTTEMHFGYTISDSSKFEILGMFLTSEKILSFNDYKERLVFDSGSFNYKNRLLYFMENYNEIAKIDNG